VRPPERLKRLLFFGGERPVAISRWKTLTVQKAELIDDCGAQLADRLGVNESFIRSEARAERIPSVKLGARYVSFRFADVERALAARKAQAR